MTFSKLQNDKYIDPKDKLDWITKDKRKGKYKIHDLKYILRTKKPFAEPDTLPEQNWR